MASDPSSSADSTPTVLGLLFFLIILALALVYFYKKLNKDTNGQYTVQRIVFAPGGVRDRLRQGVEVVENRFGVHIWPRPREDEENIGNDEGEEEGGGHDKHNDSYTEEGERQENDDDGDNSSSDYSSVDLRERAKAQMEEKKSETNEAEEEKGKQKEAAAAAGEEDKSEEVKNEEKVGLLVDLKPFTGSAIWSQENTGGNEGNDLTAL